MKRYNSKITLNKNSRGCYIIDTVKGCNYALENPGGCYGECYALKIANRYGFDFSKSVKRDFERNTTQLYFYGFCDTSHESYIINRIKNVDMPFVRIGEMGDPSYDWEHTLSICESISIAKKTIVIITKHFKPLTDSQIDGFSKLDVIFHTSISALDSENEIEYRLIQHNRLNIKCNTVLRVVTCDFIDSKKRIIQESLLSNNNVIETAFRPDKSNKYVLDGIIRVSTRKFLGSNMLISMRNDNIFLGYCYDCNDKCGVSFFKKNNRH